MMTDCALIDPATDAIQNAMAARGYARLSGAESFARLGVDAADWRDFADSWNDLGPDLYMADGGRYRRRRFAAFSVSAQKITRKTHQPHYQSRDYNALNGGVERWFDAISEAITAHPLLHECMNFCCLLFNSLTQNNPDAWHVEVHQFRIEAQLGMRGLPTPEGLHRDGVDWVLVLLIARENIAEGVTTIYDLNKHPLGSFTLTAPLDAAFVDDSRVYHGVTAVEPLDPTKPAYRDVLVVTFRRP